MHRRSKEDTPDHLGGENGNKVDYSVENSTPENRITENLEIIFGTNWNHGTSATSPFKEGKVSSVENAVVNDSNRDDKTGKNPCEPPSEEMDDPSPVCPPPLGALRVASNELPPPVVVTVIADVSPNPCTRA